MTSRSGVDAVLRELRFGAVPAPMLPVSARHAGADDGPVPFRHGLRFGRALARCPVRHGSSRRRAMTTPRARASSRCSMKPRRRWPGGPGRAAPRQRPAPARAAAPWRERFGRVGIAPLPCRLLLADQSARADRSGAGGDRGRHPRIDPSAAVPHRAGGRQLLRPRTDADLPLAVVRRSPAAAFAGARVLSSGSDCSRCGASWRWSRHPTTKRRTRAGASLTACSASRFSTTCSTARRFPWPASTRRCSRASAGCRLRRAARRARLNLTRRCGRSPPRARARAGRQPWQPA